MSFAHALIGSVGVVLRWSSASLEVLTTSSSCYSEAGNSCSCKLQGQRSR